MLRLALVFFVVSIIAGFLGFGGTARASAGVAKFFFFLFLIGAVAVLVAGFLLGSLVW